MAFYRIIIVMTVIGVGGNWTSPQSTLINSLHHKGVFSEGDAKRARERVRK